ncbi:hypothetical protein J3L12_02525 [Meiothermus sp. CFH 77666]|nr:hypothetical protein [Meiothermus sp. CFH 77666]
MRATKNNDIARAGTALRKALKTAEHLLTDPDPQTQLRAVHAVAQAAGVLVRLAEMSDLEQRILTLEQAQLKKVV